MTKIMTNRLALILNAHKILKGNNYAGLPGGSCHTPIHILESIIHDSNTYNKPLFIFFQDILKAFDSIDVNMLELATSGNFFRSYISIIITASVNITFYRIIYIDN